MYYEEKIINGILCWRTSPHGEWTPYTPIELTTRLMQVQEAIKAAGVDL